MASMAGDRKQALLALASSMRRNLDIRDRIIESSLGKRVARNTFIALDALKWLARSKHTAAFMDDTKQQVDDVPRAPAAKAATLLNEMVREGIIRIVAGSGASILDRRSVVMCRFAVDELAEPGLFSPSAGGAGLADPARSLAQNLLSDPAKAGLLASGARAAAVGMLPWWLHDGVIPGTLSIIRFSGPSSAAVKDGQITSAHVHIATAPTSKHAFGRPGQAGLQAQFDTEIQHGIRLEYDHTRWLFNAHVAANSHALTLKLTAALEGSAHALKACAQAQALVLAYARAMWANQPLEQQRQDLAAAAASRPVTWSSGDRHQALNPITRAAVVSAAMDHMRTLHPELSGRMEELLETRAKLLGRVRRVLSHVRSRVVSLALGHATATPSGSLRLESTHNKGERMVGTAEQKDAELQPVGHMKASDGSGWETVQAPKFLEFTPVIAAAPMPSPSSKAPGTGETPANRLSGPAGRPALLASKLPQDAPRARLGSRGSIGSAGLAAASLFSTSTAGRADSTGRGREAADADERSSADGSFSVASRSLPLHVSMQRRVDDQVHPTYRCTCLLPILIPPGLVLAHILSPALRQRWDSAAKSLKVVCQLEMGASVRACGGQEAAWMSSWAWLWSLGEEAEQAMDGMGTNPPDDDKYSIPDGASELGTVLTRDTAAGLASGAGTVPYVHRVLHARGWFRSVGKTGQVEGSAALESRKGDGSEWPDLDSVAAAGNTDAGTGAAGRRGGKERGEERKGDKETEDTAHLLPGSAAIINDYFGADPDVVSGDRGTATSAEPVKPSSSPVTQTQLAPPPLAPDADGAETATTARPALNACPDIDGWKLPVGSTRPPAVNTDASPGKKSRGSSAAGEAPKIIPRPRILLRRSERRDGSLGKESLVIQDWAFLPQRPAGEEGASTAGGGQTKRGTTKAALPPIVVVWEVTVNYTPSADDRSGSEKAAASLIEASNEREILLDAYILQPVPAPCAAYDDSTSPGAQACTRQPAFFTRVIRVTQLSAKQGVLHWKGPALLWRKTGLALHRLACAVADAASILQMHRPSGATSHNSRQSKQTMSSGGSVSAGFARTSADAAGLQGPLPLPNVPPSPMHAEGGKPPETGPASMERRADADTEALPTPAVSQQMPALMSVKATAPTQRPGLTPEMSMLAQIEQAVDDALEGTGAGRDASEPQIAYTAVNRGKDTVSTLHAAWAAGGLTLAYQRQQLLSVIQKPLPALSEAVFADGSEQKRTGSASVRFGASTAAKGFSRVPSSGSSSKTGVPAVSQDGQPSAPVLVATATFVRSPLTRQGVVSHRKGVLPAIPEGTSRIGGAPVAAEGLLSSPFRPLPPVPGGHSGPGSVQGQRRERAMTEGTDGGRSLSRTMLRHAPQDPALASSPAAPVAQSVLQELAEILAPEIRPTGAAQRGGGGQQAEPAQEIDCLLQHTYEDALAGQLAVYLSDNSPKLDDTMVANNAAPLRPEELSNVGRAEDKQGVVFADLGQDTSVQEAVRASALAFAGVEGENGVPDFAAVPSPALQPSATGPDAPSSRHRASAVGLHDFKLLALIGAGGYGRVLLVERIRPRAYVRCEVACGRNGDAQNGEIQLKTVLKRIWLCPSPPEDEGCIYALKVVPKVRVGKAAGPLSPALNALPGAVPAPPGHGVETELLTVPEMKLGATAVQQEATARTQRSAQRLATEKSILGAKSLHDSTPFVVRLKYAFQTQAAVCFVTEFCPGGDLFSWLNRYGPMALHGPHLRDTPLFRHVSALGAQHLPPLYSMGEEAGVLLAAELVLGIASLHANGICFRDLKAENVLLDAKGHAKLVDFGLSKVVAGDMELDDDDMSAPFASRLPGTSKPGAESALASASAQLRTQRLSIAGTELYMSPECLAMKRAGYSIVSTDTLARACEGLRTNQERPTDRLDVRQIMGLDQLPQRIQKIVAGATPSTLSPYLQALDWWALGVLLCELFTGQHPFSPIAPTGPLAQAASVDPVQEYNSTLQRVLDPAVSPVLEVYGHGGDDGLLSPAVCSFLRSLLHRDPLQRAGTSTAGGIAALMVHPFFRLSTSLTAAARHRLVAPPMLVGEQDLVRVVPLDWSAVHTRLYPSRLAPPLQSKHDLSAFQSAYTGQAADWGAAVQPGSVSHGVSFSAFSVAASVRGKAAEMLGTDAKAEDIVTEVDPAMLRPLQRGRGYSVMSSASAYSLFAVTPSVPPASRVAHGHTTQAASTVQGVRVHVSSADAGGVDRDSLALHSFSASPSASNGVGVGVGAQPNAVEPGASGPTGDGYVSEEYDYDEYGYGFDDADSQQDDLSVENEDSAGSADLEQSPVGEGDLSPTERQEAPAVPQTARSLPWTVTAHQPSLGSPALGAGAHPSASPALGPLGSPGLQAGAAWPVFGAVSMSPMGPVGFNVKPSVASLHLGGRQ